MFVLVVSDFTCYKQITGIVNTLKWLMWSVSQTSSRVTVNLTDLSRLFCLNVPYCLFCLIYDINLNIDHRPYNAMHPIMRKNVN